VARTAGRYELWVGGSFRGRLSVLVDGREVASDSHKLNYTGQYVSLGEVSLDVGRHTVQLRQAGSWRSPGSGGPAPPLGPLAVTPVGRCGAAA
jgi:hypothetical protein